MMGINIWVWIGIYVLGVFLNFVIFVLAAGAHPAPSTVRSSWKEYALLFVPYIYFII